MFIVREDSMLHLFMRFMYEISKLNDNWFGKDSISFFIIFIYILILGNMFSKINGFILKLSLSLSTSS